MCNIEQSWGIDNINIEYSDNCKKVSGDRDRRSVSNNNSKFTKVRGSTWRGGYGYKGCEDRTTSNCEHPNTMIMREDRDCDWVSKKPCQGGKPRCNRIGYESYKIDTDGKQRGIGNPSTAKDTCNLQECNDCT